MRRGSGLRAAVAFVVWASCPDLTATHQEVIAVPNSTECPDCISSSLACGVRTCMEDQPVLIHQLDFTHSAHGCHEQIPADENVIYRDLDVWCAFGDYARYVIDCENMENYGIRGFSILGGCSGDQRAFDMVNEVCAWECKHFRPFLRCRWEFNPFGRVEELDTCWFTETCGESGTQVDVVCQPSNDTEARVAEARSRQAEAEQKLLEAAASHNASLAAALADQSEAEERLAIALAKHNATLQALRAVEREHNVTRGELARARGVAAAAAQNLNRSILELEAARQELAETSNDTSLYVHYESTSCYAGGGAGSWWQEYPIGTGVQQCQAYCDALPYGDLENHCSLIVVRDNGRCYVRSGPVDLSQCPHHGYTTDTYVRKVFSNDDHVERTLVQALQELHVQREIIGMQSEGQKSLIDELDSYKAALAAEKRAHDYTLVNLKKEREKADDAKDVSYWLAVLVGMLVFLVIWLLGIVMCLLRHRRGLVAAATPGVSAQNPAYPEVVLGRPVGGSMAGGSNGSLRDMPPAKLAWLADDDVKQANP